jgi:hypothetical protein
MFPLFFMAEIVALCKLEKIDQIIVGCYKSLILTLAGE